jgi:RNA polymerase II elongation factor ELL
MLEHRCRSTLLEGHDVVYTRTDGVCCRTIVGDATTGRTPSHRRFPSTGFKASHLAPSKIGSPLLSAPSSPMHKRAPTSQPSSAHDAVVNALRVPIIHLLAREPATEASLSTICRTSLANIRGVLLKVAKRSSTDAEKWQLTDKSFREVNPFKFPYQSPEDRQQAIDGAIKSFDRQRLAKDDKLWQVLLPRDQRGQGICLSRSTVKAPEAKPKASTPMHKISDLTKKKPTAKKAVDKPAVEKKVKVAKVGETKPKSTMKEKYLAREKPSVNQVKEEPAKATTAATSTPSSSTPRPVAPSHSTPSVDASKIRTKKAPATESNSTPRVKPNMTGRNAQRDCPANRPFKPTMPVNTKPKNPSPLSASPPVNASDFADSHPVHKALAAAPSPAKTSSGNSDRSLKRKANDIDSDIHNHNLAVKKPHVDRATPNHTPAHSNGRLNGSTPSSTGSVKRKSDESFASNTPSAVPKVRKVAAIDTGLASRYHHNNPRASPGASSSSTTSPSMPSLSFRQTVELSQKFQKYYKKYEELYWQLTEAEKPPTEAQRNDLLKMHRKLEEMKREIKAGAGVHR